MSRSESGRSRGWSGYAPWALVGLVFGVAAATIASLGILFGAVGVGLAVWLVFRADEPREAGIGAGVAGVVLLASLPLFLILLGWLGTVE